MREKIINSYINRLEDEIILMESNSGNINNIQNKQRGWILINAMKYSVKLLKEEIR
jgi:hypothetical protein